MTTGIPSSPRGAPSFSSAAPAIAPSVASPPLSSQSPATKGTTFQFPREYSFPPFFTPQPNSSTHHAQLQKWSSLILSYCRYHRLFKLSLSDAASSPLFYNARINKRLDVPGMKEVVEFMRKEGRAEWLGGKGDGREVWVWWKSVDEWASAIYDWIDETAQKNTVLTLYELTDSEATVSQDFHGLDPEILQRALGVLVKRGKAQVFGQEDQQGVKFF